MPIRWTPEIDQILLLKILETSQVNADVKQISEAWPDHLEKPTPRAISERLCKIRATTKANGSAGSFSVGGVKTATPTGTPKKRAANGSGSGRGVRKNRAAGKGAGAKGAAGGGGNKKRNGNVGDDMSDDSEAEEVKSESDATLGSPSKKAKGAIKVEQNEDAGVVEPDFV